MKKNIINSLLLLILFSSLAYADVATKNVVIKETDGSPSGVVRELTVTNTTLTNNGGGKFAVITGSGSPTDADYLVGTANASLSAEIVVGTTPGGELGGTWATPTIDDSITVTGWRLGASTATAPAANDADTSLATTAFCETTQDYLKTSENNDDAASLANIQTACTNDFHNIGGTDANTTYTGGDFLTLTGTDFDVDTAAVGNGDTTHLPTCDGVFDFCETTQAYYNSGDSPSFGNITATGTSPAYYLDPTSGDTWHIFSGAESYLAFSNWTHGVEVLTLNNDNNATFYQDVQARDFNATRNIGAIGSVGGATLSISGAVTITEGALADSTIVSADIKDGTIVGGDLATNIAITTTGAQDFGGATSFEIPNGADPDLTVAGQVSFDTDGANETGDCYFRAFDGTNQYPVGKKLVTVIDKYINAPDLLDDPNTVVVWHNTSGMTFTITEWKAWSDTDNVSLVINELTDMTDFTAITAVDAVEIATNGTSVFYASDTTITHATIEHDHSVSLDFDQTDTPKWVHIVVTGWFDANVN